MLHHGSKEIWICPSVALLSRNCDVMHCNAFWCFADLKKTKTTICRCFSGPRKCECLLMVCSDQKLIHSICSFFLSSSTNASHITTSSNDCVTTSQLISLSHQSLSISFQTRVLMHQDKKLEKHIFHWSWNVFDLCDSVFASGCAAPGSFASNMWILSLLSE